MGLDGTSFAGVTLPTSISIDKDAIVYDNDIEYVVTYVSTSASAPADSVFTGALSTSLTSALQAEGFNATEISSAVAAAQTAATVTTVDTGGGGTTTTDTSGASSVTVVASLVAGLVTLLL